MEEKEAVKDTIGVKEMIANTFNNTIFEMMFVHKVNFLELIK